MPSPKRTLQIAACSNGSNALKPEPPVDLWEQLEKHIQALPTGFEPPPGAFTKKQFREKFNLSHARANARLEKLLKAGKIQRFGRCGQGAYYTLV